MAGSEIEEGFADWFRRIRAASGETYRQIARDPEIDVSENTVRDWEKGKYLPRAGKLVKVRRHFQPYLRREEFINPRPTNEGWVKRGDLNPHPPAKLGAGG